MSSRRSLFSKSVSSDDDELTHMDADDAHSQHVHDDDEPAADAADDDDDE